MPSWCMFCGDAKMPDTGTSVKRGRKGLKWKKPSRVAPRWKRITVCWECYKKVTCEMRDVLRILQFVTNNY